MNHGNREIDCWRPLPCNVGVQYAFALKSAAMGVIYGPLYPPAYAVTAVSLAFSWIATRIALRYYYRRPESLNQEMMLEMIRRLAQTLALSIAFQIIAVYNASAHAASSAAEREELENLGGWGTVGIVYIGGPVSLLLAACFPYSCFRCCANVDELTDADAVIESQGIAHDQVSKQPSTRNDPTRVAHG